MNILRKYILYNDHQYKNTWDEFHLYENVVERLYKKCNITIGDHDAIHDIDRIRHTMFLNVVGCMTDLGYDSGIETNDYHCHICGSSFRFTINTNTLHCNIHQYLVRDGCDTSLYTGYSKHIDVYNNTLVISSVVYGKPKLTSMRGRKEIGDARNNRYDNTINFTAPYIMEVNIHNKNDDIWLSNDSYTDNYYNCNLIHVTDIMISTDSKVHDAHIIAQREILVKNGRYKITNNIENVTESSHNQIILTIEPVYYF